MKTKEMAIAAVLAALAILIPYFSITLPIPPFTATFASHVAVIIAMFVSPWVAMLAAIGSAVGFWLKGLGPDVFARAMTHVIFAVSGAYMIKYLVKKTYHIVFVAAITGILHALAEAIIVLPFGGKYTLAVAFGIVGVGTLIHHCIDFVIALVIVVPLRKQRFLR